jgi:hypothetical protein
MKGLVYAAFFDGPIKQVNILSVLSFPSPLPQKNLKNPSWQLERSQDMSQRITLYNLEHYILITGL